jgi:hypothetical protein
MALNIREHWKAIAALVPVAAVCKYLLRSWKRGRAMRQRLTLASCTDLYGIPFDGGEWSYLTLSLQNNFLRALDRVTVTLEFAHKSSRRILAPRGGLFVSREGGVISADSAMIVDREVSLAPDECAAILFTTYTQKRDFRLPEWPLSRHAEPFAPGFWTCKVSVCEGSKSRAVSTYELNVATGGKELGKVFQFRETRSWFRRVFAD